MCTSTSKCAAKVPAELPSGTGREPRAASYWQQTLEVEESDDESRTRKEIALAKEATLKRGRDGGVGEEDEREPRRMRLDMPLGDEEGEDEGGVVVADQYALANGRAALPDAHNDDNVTGKAEQEVVDSDDDSDDDYEGDDEDEDEDEDEERQDEEELELARLVGSDATYEDEGHDVEASTGRRLNVAHDPDAFVALDIGPRDPPKSFAKKKKADIDAKHAQARVYAVEYFQRRKDEAALLDYGATPPTTSSFCRKSLRIYQNKYLTAEILADKFQFGQSDYVRYLFGLDRPRSTEEHLAIPAPTSEQLKGTLVYSDLIMKDGKKYHYGGSGTSRRGGGERMRAYEKLLQKVQASPAGEHVADEYESHTNLMLHPDSECHLRVILAWPRKNISPDMAVVMEAAQVDLERYMSEALPTAADNGSFWAQNHCKEIRDMSYSMFPDGRSQGDFIGLNRAHPLKQGANVGTAKHRRTIGDEVGWICSLCKGDKSGCTDKAKYQFRLAADVNFPVEDAVIFCRRCVKAWRKVEVQDLETAHALLDNPPLSKKERRILQLAAQGNLCSYCEGPVGTKGKARLTGYEGKVICYPCRNTQEAFLGSNPNPSAKDIKDFIARKKKLLKSRESRAPRPVAQQCSCFACGTTSEIKCWCKGLSGFEDRRMCVKCDRARRTKAGLELFKDPRAFIKSRMEFREQTHKLVGYTATGEGNGEQCPCCSGLDNLNEEVCEIDDHEDVRACDDCVEAWPDNDEHTMSAWFDFAVERKLATANTINQRDVSKKKVFCPDCGKGYVDANGLELHQIAKHNAVAKKPALLKANAAGMFACPSCGQEFGFPDLVYRHWRNKSNACRKPGDESASGMEDGEDQSDSDVQESQPSRTLRSAKKTANKSTTSSAKASGKKARSTARSSKSSSAKRSGKKAQKEESDDESEDWDEESGDE
jgi:hypothetical protein